MTSMCVGIVRRPLSEWHPPLNEALPRAHCFTSREESSVLLREKRGSIPRLRLQQYSDESCRAKLSGTQSRQAPQTIWRVKNKADVAMASISAFVTNVHGLFSVRPRRRRSPAITSIADQQPVANVKRRDGSFPSRPGAKTYQVTVENPKKGTVNTYTVPEDRYIWHSMTDAGADIPSSCRNGCCTTCAAKLSDGSVDQKEALGLLKEMRSNGYALLCVSYPKSDIHCVLQDEDEVYMKQFGSSFESGGTEWGGVLPEDD